MDFNGLLMDFNGILMDFNGIEWDLPSGYVKIAIENGHRNSEFSHSKWWIFP